GTVEPDRRTCRTTEHPGRFGGAAHVSGSLEYKGCNSRRPCTVKNGFVRGGKNGKTLQSSEGHYGTMNLRNITADRLVPLYANRDVTVTEVITSIFEEIDRSDRNIHAYITLCRERALEEARRTDSRIAAGEPINVLTGVPIA